MQRTLADRLVELYKADTPDVVTVVLNVQRLRGPARAAPSSCTAISQQDANIMDVVRRAKADATSTAAHAGRAREAARRTSPRRSRRSATRSRRCASASSTAATASRRPARRSSRCCESSRDRRHQLEDDVASLQNAQAKIQAKLAGFAGSQPAGPIRGGSGGLIWPVNGPITSPFCESRAWESCHPGIDIGVPSGTPIRAAAAGKVVLMQPEAASGGYGNFTCIQHTSSLSTCYAHQSRFGTSIGAQVSQGQVIGYSGCTGRCFGPHLHFETRINGSVVNPMNYL